MSHIPPAGWVYVAWHPRSSGYTKIGYSKAHPTEPDDRYTFKRVHQVGRHLVSFGFGSLECWSSPFSERAKLVESAVQKELKARGLQHRDVGPSTDMFKVDPQDAIALVQSHLQDRGV